MSTGRALRTSSRASRTAAAQVDVSTGVLIADPIYQGPQDAATLTSAYTQALARADEVGATSVAFPSISTGAYGYPLAEAAAVSMQALCGAVTAVQSVLLVAFSHRVQELWEQALEA